jgi:hypothetical protein
VILYLKQGCLHEPATSNEQAIWWVRVAGVSFDDHQNLVGHRSGGFTTHYSTTGVNFKRGASLHELQLLPVTVQDFVANDHLAHIVGAW